MAKKKTDEAAITQASAGAEEVKDYDAMTQVDEKEIKEGFWEDEHKVKYSLDRKRLLRSGGHIPSKYIVPQGTEVICDGAFEPTPVCFSVEIPGSVIAIGKKAFTSKVTSVKIGNGVESIGERAFADSDCRKFSLPKSVKRIGAFAVPKAKAYESKSAHCPIVNDCLLSGNKMVAYVGEGPNVVIPEGVSTICERAFYYRYFEMKKVEIPASVTKIEPYAFYYCRHVEEISIPDSVVEIGKGAFQECSDLKKVTLPKALGKIESHTFFKCSKLESVVIPDSVEGAMPSMVKIEPYAFGHCKMLKEISIPDSVEEIGEGAFDTCSALKKVTLPKALVKIESYAFYQCPELESIVIPDGVAEISAWAFGYCTSLGSVSISGTPHVDEFAFMGCPNNRYAWTDEMGVAYSLDKKRLLVVTKQIDGEYSIPMGTEEICDDAFFYKKDMHYRHLKGVTIPDGVTAIGARAFACCDMKAVTLPASVKVVGKCAFAQCYSLETVNLLGSPEMGENPFVGCKESMKIRKPGEAEEPEEKQNPYDAMTQVDEDEVENHFWKDEYGVKYSLDKKRLLATGYLPGKYVVQPGTEVICDRAFYCSSARSVELPGSVIAIGKEAFVKDSFRKSSMIVKMGKNVESIGEDAFNRCEYKKFTLPMALKRIANDTALPQAFEFESESKHCPIINGCLIEGEKLVLYVGHDVVLNIPDVVKVIGKRAFWQRRDILAKVKIPDSVTVIEPMAFLRCWNIRDITIPASVTVIGKSAFSGCRALKKINILGSPEIGEDAFEDCPGYKK